MFNRFKFFLMNKYCPRFLEEMPINDDCRLYEAHSIIVYGYWGNKERIVERKLVAGLRNAYIESRWLALKTQIMLPRFIFDCGINYGVKEL